MKVRITIFPGFQRQNGSTVLVLMTLLGIMVMLAVASHKALFHLRREIKLLENRQVERLNTAQGNTITTPARPPNRESK
jgi:hypothetical protein